MDKSIQGQDEENMTWGQTNECLRTQLYKTNLQSEGMSNEPKAQTRLFAAGMTSLHAFDVSPMQ